MKFTTIFHFDTNEITITTSTGWIIPFTEKEIALEIKTDEARINEIERRFNLARPIHETHARTQVRTQTTFLSMLHPT